MKLVELNWAGEALTEMHGAKSLERYEKAWIDFLHYLDRAWNKLHDYCDVNKTGQKYVSTVEHLRKKDKLLQYLKQARDSHEHSIREVLAVEAAKTTITGGAGGGVIARGVIHGSGQTQGLVTSGNVEVKFHPERLVAIPVSSCGNHYEVPTQHLGNALTTNVPHELALLGLTYYSDIAEKILPQGT